MFRSLDIKADKDLFELVICRKELELLNKIQLQDIFQDSRILIIGAGGSIGSAIARNLVAANIHNVFFMDRDESSLHGLALELSNLAASQSENCFIADIRDRSSIREILDQIRPTVVIHAAALKHLVILERFPREGYLTNVIGTLNIAQLCAEYGIQQFINISTDKAANPSSILGKTKKIAELISQELFENSGLIASSVRFGNVFASRGSVIETFIHQIQNNLPVTVSDLNVARYFMSHNEAANLVLAAASLKESGTYIQNMGEEILITDIVNRIAKYLNKNPMIQFTGLKNGEKMREELYDGPVQKTLFKSISRSIHPITRGLVEDIVNNQPKNNIEAVNKIENLMSKYLKSY
jgi:dTDP-glucose 4,6-dehydratase